MNKKFQAIGHNYSIKQLLIAVSQGFVAKTNDLLISKNTKTSMVDIFKEQNQIQFLKFTGHELL